MLPKQIYAQIDTRFSFALQLRLSVPLLVQPSSLAGVYTLASAIFLILTAGATFSWYRINNALNMARLFQASSDWISELTVHLFMAFIHLRLLSVDLVAKVRPLKPKRF